MTSSASSSAPLAPVLVVGGGQAGARAVRALLDEGAGRPVILAAAEPHAPYDRPPLSKSLLRAFAPEAADPLFPAEVLADPRLEMVLGDPVTAIDHATRVATLASGRSIAFGPLILATGGRPRPLPCAGAELALTLRDLDDCGRLATAMQTARSLVVIGGGVIGLEVAEAAREAGLEVTVLEAGPRIMARILPPLASDWLAERHRAAGIAIETGIRVQAIRAEGSGHVVETDQGLRTADIVLAAVGMLPNTELVPDSAIGPLGGILTDAGGRVAGLRDTYAAGDVAESLSPLAGGHVRLETWRNAERQPLAIARTIAGQPTDHAEVPWMWTDQHGHNLQVVGTWAEDCTQVARGTVGDKGSSLFWTRDGILLGGVLFDNGRDRRFLEALVEARTAVPHDRLSDTEVRLKTLA